MNSHSPSPTAAFDELLAHGLQYLQHNQAEVAQAIFTEAVATEPCHPVAHFGLGRAYYLLGQMQTALQCYEQTVHLAPAYAPGYIGLAMVLRDFGEPGQALQAVRQGLKLNPLVVEGRKTLASLLYHLELGSTNPELEGDLRACFTEPDIDHQKLASLAADFLVRKHRLYLAMPSNDNVQDAIAFMATDGLWLNYLARVINANPLLEQLLTLVRAVLLKSAVAGLLSDAHLALVAALGLQCFANEYLFNSSTAERSMLADLEAQISPVNVLLRAMYQPLISLQDSQVLHGSAIAHQPLVAQLIERTLTDLQVEAEWRCAISGINSDVEAEDKTSAAVRNQYEQNPYPRWQAPPAPKPCSMRQIIHHQPMFDDRAILGEPLNVLVAGCGTGFEPIDIKRMDSSLTLTALDLSANSLAYAMRMAATLGVEDIQFRQGDILNVAELGQQFDLVIATGVLHHMAEPVTGWRRLVDVTKPGGVMRIGLYSELARRRIVAARTQIAALGLSGSAEDIRIFRRKILSGALGQELTQLAWSDDFYSLSACRDLLFHVQEHRFDFNQLATITAALGLKVIGIDLPAAWVARDFTALFPTPDALCDLAKWHEFEVRNPDTFVGMYQLWLQKPVLAPEEE